MLLEEQKEIFPANKVQLAGLHRLNCHLIGLARHHRIQPENYSGVRDPQDQSFSVAGSGADFRLTLAKQEYAARSLSFNEYDDAARKNRRMLDLVKSVSRCLR